MNKKPAGRKKKENVLAKYSGKVLADIIGRLQMMDMKKTMTGAIPYLIVFYLIEKEAWLYRHCTGNTMIQKMMNLVMYFGLAFRNPVPSPFWWDVVVGIIGAVSFWAFIRYRRKNAKKYRQGVEYGSARWGTAKDIAPYIDPVFDNNIILTMTEFLTMNSRPKNWRFARNKNVIVIGGSGSGKTRNFIKPNLMQLSDKTSYVVTDPKGTIIIECGKMLVRHGYTIKVLNTINFAKSMHYNPFHYIRSEKDILKLVNTIIANTKGEGEKSSEDFWVKAERLLYCALIGFIYYEAPEEEQNFSTLLEFLNASEAREDDEEFKNAVDLMFEELEAEDPEHFAVRHKVDTIEESIKKVLDHISLEHPYSPDFGYDYVNGALRSTPLTPEARRLYPPSVVLTGAVKIGDQYLNNPNINPINYAYRHQLTIMMEVSKAKKLLGEREDPIQSEVAGLVGSTLVATPPEFPPAFPCSIKVDDQTFFEYVLLRTQEIRDDGVYVIGNKEQGGPFYFEIRINPDNPSKPDFKLNMNHANNHELLNYVQFMNTLSRKKALHIYALALGEDFIAGYINDINYKTACSCINLRIGMNSNIIVRGIKTNNLKDISMDSFQRYLRRRICCFQIL